MRTTLPPIGDPLVRYEARDKVTGRTRYAADEPVGQPLHAALVTSTVARGRITGFDLATAESVEGVRLILTHETMPAIADVTAYSAGGVGQSSFFQLGSPEIRFDGQIVAMVVAETPEAAREAAALVDVQTEAEDAVAAIGADAAPEPRAVPSDFFEGVEKGDVDAALAEAAVTLEAEYSTPVQHHNPIELHAATAVWRDDLLTVYTPTQWLTGTRAALATAFDLAVEKVRVVSTFVGGGFGAKALVMSHVYVVAAAARITRRPVTLYVSRHEGFTVGIYRPATRQRIRIGADADGRLTALDHTQIGGTSRFDTIFLPGTEQTARMYDWGAIRTAEQVVETDLNTPGPMRAPAEVPTLFALESAVDELAFDLGVDPLEMRLRSDAPEREPVAGLPWTSRSLAECLERGADVFGWADRPSETGATMRGDWLIGWGCASAVYPIYTAPALASLRLGSDLSARVGAAVHDLGTGTYTVAQQIVARELGLPPDNVRVEMGDSDLASNAVAGGSRQTASVGSAILDACRRVRAALAETATGEEGPLAGADPAAVRLEDGRLVAGERSVALGEAVGRLPFGVIEVRGQYVPPSASPKSVRELYRTGAATTLGFVTDSHARAAFGAHFVEVAVDRRTGAIRVPRMVGAFAAGRIVNERTARSQLMGGMIWGVSSALHEATEVDHARFVNADLGEYLMTVNADVPDVRVAFVEEEDASTPLGAKGIGELGITGVNAAIANAVHHATGVRLRHLPIRMEALLDA